MNYYKGSIDFSEIFIIISFIPYDLRLSAQFLTGAERRCQEKWGRGRRQTLLTQPRRRSTKKSWKNVIHCIQIQKMVRYFIYFSLFKSQFLLLCNTIREKRAVTDGDRTEKDVMEKKSTVKWFLILIVCFTFVVS